MHFFFAVAIRPLHPFPRVRHAGTAPLSGGVRSEPHECCPPMPPSPGASPSVALTILQHLAPPCTALSRKFHTFHLAAICRVFSQLLLFAGLADVGTRGSCAAASRPAMGRVISR